MYHSIKNTKFISLVSRCFWSNVAVCLDVRNLQRRLKHTQSIPMVCEAEMHHILQLLNLRTVLFFVIEASWYCLVQFVLLSGNLGDLSLWTSCVFCWIYTLILLIKPRTDISLEYLFGLRRKDINWHHATRTCGLRLLCYSSV